MKPDSERSQDSSGGWLRPAVFGIMDGLVSNMALIAGVSASISVSNSGFSATVLVAGLAGLGAGAFSMAAGEYVSVASQRSLIQSQQEKTTNPNASSDFVYAHVNPLTAAIASFLAFALGAFIPLSPYIFGAETVFPSALITGFALFASGAAVGQITSDSPMKTGLRQLLFGAAAGFATHALGLLAGTFIA